MGVVICLERGVGLHMAQQIPLPLTVSCFRKIQIGFTFLVPAHLGSPGQRAVKRVCVCVCVCVSAIRANSIGLPQVPYEVFIVRLLCYRSRFDYFSLLWFRALDSFSFSTSGCS